MHRRCTRRITVKADVSEAAVGFGCYSFLKCKLRRCRRRWKLFDVGARVLLDWTAVDLESKSSIWSILVAVVVGIVHDAILLRLFNTYVAAPPLLLRLANVYTLTCLRR